MSQYRLALVLVILAACCGGCSQDELLQKFTTPEDQATATEQLDLLRNHRFDELEARMQPDLRTPTLRTTLEAMAKGLPADDPTERKLVGAYTNVMNGEKSTNLTWQYRFGERYVLANCAFTRQQGQVVILGMEVRPLTASLESTNKLTFKNKPARHYVMLAAVVLALLLTLVALVACVMEPTPKYKWAWVIMILLGITQTSLNWTSGEMGFSKFYFQLFSVGLVAGAYSPWIVSVSVPLGAIAYLVRRLLNSRRPPLSEV